MNQIIIPQEAVKFILYQRTAFLKFPNTFVNRWLSIIIPFSIYYKQVVNRQAKTNSLSIKELYINNLKQEYLTIKDYLPNTCSSVLDIGCGVAGINILINKHYGNNQQMFYLLDKTGISKRFHYSYKPKGAFYNSLDVAKELLIGNHIPERNINLIEATNNNDIKINSNVNLVISLISWGFHYPIETYLNRVYELLTNGGSLIIDVRKETNGIQDLNKVFRKVEVIYEEEKIQRVLAIK